MALITPSTWTYLAKGFEFSRFVQFHPFIWNNDRKRPELITSGRRLLPWYFNALATFVYYGFVVFRAVQTKLDENASTAEQIYMQFNVVYFMFPVIFQASILSNKEEYVIFAQKFLRFLQLYQERLFYCQPPAKWSKLSGSICASVYYSFYLNEFLVICCSYFRPQSPELLSSLLPNPESLLWFQRIPFVLWHLYVMTAFVEAALMYIFTSLAFVLPTMDLVEYLSSGQQGRWAVHADTSRSFILYNQIQRLIAEFNDSIGRVFQGCKILLIFMAIFCTYGGIRFSGLLAICLGWIGTSTTAFLVFMLGCLGEFHNKSKKLLFQWQKQTVIVRHRDELQALWFRKQLRSTTTIQIRFGSLYHIDKGIVLTCFRTIFEAVINFLILNK